MSRPAVDTLPASPGRSVRALRWRAWLARVVWQRQSDVPRSLATRRAVVFATALALPVYYGVRGGSYDVLVRHEEALVLWSVLGVGFAFGVLPRARWRRSLWIPLGALAAVVALLLVSLVWTASDGRTVEEVTRLSHYGGIVLLGLAGLSRHTWRAAAAGLSTGLVVVCAIALASRLELFGFEDEVASYFDPSRLSYPLDYWNATAAWAAMALAALVAWSAHARQPLLRGLTLAAAPLAGLAAYLSYSRAGVVGVAVGVVSVCILSRNRWSVSLNAAAAAAAIAFAILVVRDHPEIADGTGGAGAGAVALALLAGGFGCAAVAVIGAITGLDRVRMNRRLARLGIGTAAVVGTLLLVTAGRPALEEGWREFSQQRSVASGADPSARLTAAGGTRYEIWDAAIDAFRSAPVEGIGAGTFELWWAESGGAEEFVRDAHSLYLEQLAETGFPGFALLLVFVGGLLALALRARKEQDRAVDVGAAAATISVFIVYLIHAGVDWMWEVTAVSMVGFGAISIAVASAAPARRARPAAPLRRWSVVALCLASVLVQVPGLVSTARSRSSAAELARGDSLAAFRLADEAVAAEPWASPPYLARANAAAALGRFDRTRADLLAAIEREPTNWRPWLLLARLELRTGDRERAFDAFSEARRLNPRSQLLRGMSEFESRDGEAQGS
jgi:tetratricopeptide (TPR) repeat protein